MLVLVCLQQCSSHRTPMHRPHFPRPLPSLVICLNTTPPSLPPSVFVEELDATAWRQAPPNAPYKHPPRPLPGRRPQTQDAQTLHHSRVAAHAIRAQQHLLHERTAHNQSPAPSEHVYTHPCTLETLCAIPPRATFMSCGLPSKQLNLACAKDLSTSCVLTHSQNNDMCHHSPQLAYMCRAQQRPAFLNGRLQTHERPLNPGPKIKLFCNSQPD